MTRPDRPSADPKAEPGLSPARDVAAALRALLRRGTELRGQRANPFRRLAAAVMRPPKAARHLRSDRPQFTPRSVAMPYGRSTLSTLGTGLAGGGGGSPGFRNRVLPHPAPVPCDRPGTPALAA